MPHGFDIDLVAQLLIHQVFGVEAILRTHGHPPCFGFVAGSVVGECRLNFFNSFLKGLEVDRKLANAFLHLIYGALLGP